MMREDVLNKVNEIFREIFDDDSIVVWDETTAADIDDWDSLEHINLIVAIEKAFHIKFSMDEVNTMKDVGTMIDIILERI